MLARTLIPQSEATNGAAKPRAILAIPENGKGELALDGLLLDKVIGHRKPKDTAISIGLHMAVVAAILLAPMVFAQRLVMAKAETTFLTAPLLPYAPPPPMGSARAMTKTSLATPKLTAPVSIPKAISQSASVSEAAAPEVASGMAGVNGGLPDGILGGILGGMGAGPAVPEIGQVGALRVGGQVQRPELVYNPEPEYPKDAKKAKVQGDVKVDAIVDKDGNVVQVHAISGPSLLVDAAVRAVSQWKYQPTYLNGKPYPLELIVDVNFHLG